MSDDQSPQVHVHALERREAEERAHLVVAYGGKEARIEIPVAAPQYDREPKAHAIRRELMDMLEALDQALASPENIPLPFGR